MKIIKYLTTKRVAMYIGVMGLVGSLTIATSTQAASKSEDENCTADPAWFSSPSLPTEVKKSNKDGSSNFCDFYQFSWQTFAYLMAPSANDKKIRNFADVSQFPELEVDDDGNPVNSCDKQRSGNKLFVRTTKPRDPDNPFPIPERIGQAGGGATIYDKKGNVVFYDVRFSRNMCDIAAIDAAANFPGGTLELKGAWKVLTKPDAARDYITMDAKIGSDSKTTKLGLIGFHVAIATPDHPEMIWATFEHNNNVPDCANPTSLKSWSFTSEHCAEALKKGESLAIVQCNFNNPSAQTDPTKITGTPTEICREYPHGTAPNDPGHAENIRDITALNKNVKPHLKKSFKVLNNYFNLGALWVSDTKQKSDINNQRGSLRLANSVAETEYQNVNTKSKKFISNCFGCHNYVGTNSPTTGKNTTSGSLSHIFIDIAIGAGQCLDVQAEKAVNNQGQAKTTCTSSCTNASGKLEWNGQWTNTDAKSGAQLPIAVCGCCGVKK